MTPIFDLSYLTYFNILDLPILLMAVTQNPYRRPVGESWKNRNINAMIMYFVNKLYGNITNERMLEIQTIITIENARSNR